MTTEDRLIPLDPAVRAGLYKQFNEVPAHHRLQNHASRFEARDVWGEYIVATDILSDNPSDNHRQRIERTEQRWKSYMDQRNTHHALCNPVDAAEFGGYLLEEYEICQILAARYWGEIERFYRWMFNHTEFPHRYNPFVMAAISDDTASDLWHAIMDRS